MFPELVRGPLLSTFKGGVGYAEKGEDAVARMFEANLKDRALATLSAARMCDILLEAKLLPGVSAWNN